MTNRNPVPGVTVRFHLTTSAQGMPCASPLYYAHSMSLSAGAGRSGFGSSIIAKVGVKSVAGIQSSYEERQ